MAQALAKHAGPVVDHFVVLGIPRRLDLDPADLERRYHEAARQVHPDRHQTAAPQEQARSLAASAALNQAYRTLRDSVARGRHWLDLHGDPLGTDNNRVPAELAALVFEVQEQLAEARGGRADRVAIDEARRTLSDRLEALVTALEAGYARDGGASDAAALSALKRTLSEIAYLRTLLRDVDAVLAG